MTFKAWDVVAVPFPFMERPAVKRRPALILSTQDFNDNEGHAIMAMITAAMLDRRPSDYLLLEPAHAGLRLNCYVRWKVFTLPAIMIVKTLGPLSVKDRKGVKQKARAVFAQA